MILFALGFVSCWLLQTGLGMIATFFQLHPLPHPWNHPSDNERFPEISHDAAGCLNENDLNELSRSDAALEAKDTLELNAPPPLPDSELPKPVEKQ